MPILYKHPNVRQRQLSNAFFLIVSSCCPNTFASSSSISRLSESRAPTARLLIAQAHYYDVYLKHI